MAKGGALDEHERVAVDDRGDLGALADWGGHTLQRVPGQRAAWAAAGDRDRHGLGAPVVGSGAVERTLDYTVRAEGIVFSPDGTLVSAFDATPEGYIPGLGGAGVWSVATGQLVGPLLGAGDFYGAVAFSPDNAILATGGVLQSSRVTRWDLRTMQQLGTPLNVDGPITSAGIALVKSKSATALP